MKRAPAAAAIASSASACRPLPTTIEASESRIDVLELRRRMRDRERHGDAAGEPDAARDDDVREARRDEKGDARSREIVRRPRRAPPRRAPRPARGRSTRRRRQRRRWRGGRKRWVIVAASVPASQAVHVNHRSADPVFRGRRAPYLVTVRFVNAFITPADALRVGHANLRACATLSAPSRR